MYMATTPSIRKIANHFKVKVSDLHYGKLENVTGWFYQGKFIGESFPKIRDSAAWLLKELPTNEKQ